MVTSALKLGTEGAGGRQGCLVQGEQEALSGRQTPEQPAVCPSRGPRFVGRVTAELQGGSVLVFEGRREPSVSAGSPVCRRGADERESWATWSGHQAGSSRGQEFGLRLNGGGEAAGKQTSAQVLTCPAKLTEGRGCGIRPRLGEWRAHTETLPDSGQVSLSSASGRGQVRHLAAASRTKLGSWSSGFSQDVRFSSLALHVLPQKARKRPDRVSDRQPCVSFTPF